MSTHIILVIRHAGQAAAGGLTCSLDLLRPTLFLDELATLKGPQEERNILLGGCGGGCYAEMALWRM